MIDFDAWINSPLTKALKDSHRAQTQKLEDALRELIEAATHHQADARQAIANARAATREEKISRPGVYEVKVESAKKREWVGLTDEEVEDDWERITGHSIFGGDKAEGRTMYLSPDEVREFARYIEAKLKEKNT